MEFAQVAIENIANWGVYVIGKIVVVRGMDAVRAAALDPKLKFTISNQLPHSRHLAGQRIENALKVEKADALLLGLTTLLCTASKLRCDCRECARILQKVDSVQRHKYLRKYAYRGEKK